jgi:hypothetical protein
MFGVECEMIRADPALRRWALAIVLGMTIFGAIVIAYLPDTLHELLALAVRSPEEAGRRATLVLLAVVAPATVLGMWAGIDAIRRSRRALRAEQYPAPGSRVVRDTPVLRGRAARVAGTLGVVLGSALIALAVALPYTAYRAGMVLRQGCPRRLRHDPRPGATPRDVERSAPTSAT